MAPMTRSGALAPPRSDLLHQNSRQASWQFVGSDIGSEREVSEEPTSSHEEGEMAYGDDQGEEEDEYDDASPLETSEDNEDILHPLRETANRVGREVERFAEVLDEYNPVRVMDELPDYETTFGLVQGYNNIAAETLKSLRHRHGKERRNNQTYRRKANARGSRSADDSDEMEIEDSLELVSGNSQTTVADLERWEAEARTWDLLRRLMEIRHAEPPKDEEKFQPHQFSTESEVWHDFLKLEPLALERKTVLEWLKVAADQSGEDIDDIVKDLQQNADRGDIVAHGWIHTKSAIKQRKMLHSWPQALDPSSAEVSRVHLNASKTEPLITQLDPDAMTRQSRKLEKPDQSFARSISLGCYELLRRGRSLEDIKDFCSQRTELWRTVSMSGFPGDHHNKEDELGNPVTSALWRRMCFALARKGGGDIFERAVYGILSGDIQSVEPVCKSWDDFIFAHYNALLRTQFDKHLQELYSEPAFAVNFSTFEAFDAVQFHGEPQEAGRKLIESLKLDSRTSSETLDPMNMLQGVLIADQFEDFVYQQGLALSKFANASGRSNLIPATKERPENEDVTRYITMDDHDSLRALVHMLLIYKSTGMVFGPHRQPIVENIIVSYISFLRLAGKEELIPLYCSQLSGTRRYATLSRNLVDVVNPDQRMTQIHLMKNLGLDVQEFVSYQARYLAFDHSDQEQGYPGSGFKMMELDPQSDGTGRRIIPDFFGKDPDQIDMVDMLLIRSLEWFLLVDGMWSETFTFGTMVYLRFFKHMRLNAARKLVEKVRSDTIAISKTRKLIGERLDFSGLEAEAEDEDMTEILDGTADQKRQLKKYLVAEAKTFRELEALIIALDGMETVAGHAVIMSENSADPMRKDWRRQMAVEIMPAKDTVVPLLKGWLLSSQEEMPQLERLREAYLPDTILAYIFALQLGGSALTRDLLMECMELSTIIADDESDLLALFVKLNRLPELVEALAKASKTLLLVNAGQRKQTGSKGKKLRQKGWTTGIWNVEP